MIRPSAQCRRDLGGLAPEVVREVLELAKKPIAAEISRLSRALSRCVAIDADDLRSLGQIAALEAAKTHDPSKGTTLRSWIGTSIRYRLAEAMKSVGDAASREVKVGLAGDLERNFLGHAGEADRRLRVSDEAALVAEESTSETVAHGQARAWVLRSLARLTPRQRILLVQRLANNDEPDVALGSSLGLGSSMVSRDFAVAVEKLRARHVLEDAGGVACV